MAGEQTQAAARTAAIAQGHSPEEVDAFIAAQGGARTSAQRITSAFGVAGSTGTNDLSTFHAQKATAAGADASGKGTYLSGATQGFSLAPGGAPAPAPVPAPAPAPAPVGGDIPLPPSMDALTALTSGGGGGGGGADTGGGGILNLAEAPASLRSLGRRNPAQESMELASKGRRVY